MPGGYGTMCPTLHFLKVSRHSAFMRLNDEMNACRSSLQQDRQIIFLPLMGGFLGVRREPATSFSTPSGGFPAWSAR